MFQKPRTGAGAELQSQTAPEGRQPTPLPNRGPAPAPAPPPVSSACSINSRTVYHAVDGSPDTRRKVGVNELVALASSVKAVWSATGGGFSQEIDRTIIWTAPTKGGSFEVTAAPATGSPCAISFEVVPPTGRALKHIEDLAYSPVLAGSGFRADVGYLPGDVSFAGVQMMEGSADGVAKGYYDTVLHQNGKVHPPTQWVVPDPPQSKIEDTVGTKRPGTGGPFMPGTFVWRIPMMYRAIRDQGDGTEFARPQQTLEMYGKDGRETTDKEGGHGDRTPPGPPKAVGAPRPEGEP